jgi:hypothetical protein
LAKFRIDAREATRKEVHHFTGSNPVVRFLNKRNNYLHCPGVFAQPHYHFYEDFFMLPTDIYLSGYWQSEKYFSSSEDAIRNQFTPVDLLDTRNQELKSVMQSENSVAVHVRRGDYASQTQYASFFGLLQKEYYDKAISAITSRIDHPKFYFFSDNPEWCREAFNGMQAEVIDHNKGGDAYKDLLLMASCKHNIIANSTFSWWSAWLNNHENKIVIVPSTWFRTNFLSKKEPVYASRFYNTKDLIPASWTII